MRSVQDWANYFLPMLQQGTGIMVPNHRQVYPVADSIQHGLDTGIMHLLRESENGEYYFESYTNNTIVLEILENGEPSFPKEKEGFYTAKRIEYGKTVRLVGNKTLPVNPPEPYFFIPNEVSLGMMYALMQYLESLPTKTARIEVEGHSPQLISAPFHYVDTGFPAVEAMVAENPDYLRTIPVTLAAFASGIDSPTVAPSRNVYLLLIDSIRPAEPIVRTMQDSIFKNLVIRFISEGTGEDHEKRKRLIHKINTDYIDGNFGLYKTRYVNLYNRVRKLFYSEPVPIDVTGYTAENMEDLLRDGLYHITYVSRKGRTLSDWVTRDYDALTYFYTQKELFNFKSDRSKIDYLNNYPGGAEAAISAGLLSVEEYLVLSNKEFGSTSSRTPAEGTFTAMSLFADKGGSLWHTFGVDQIVNLTKVGE